MNSKHEVAVLHILNRVVVDRTFSWLMMGTETLNLCLQAEAYRTGKTVEECEQWLQKRMELEDQRLKSMGEDTPYVKRLETKIAELELVLAMTSDESDIDDRREVPLHALSPLEYLEATALP